MISYLSKEMLKDYIIKEVNIKEKGVLAINDR